MKLPRWVPEVRRPFNPAFRDTWEAMTHTERQVSWLVDWCLVLVVVIGLGLLAGCGEDTSAQALDRYSILMATDTTTPAERCKASGEVADAFLHEGNRESYRTWHAIHTIQCMAEGPMVVG